MSNLFMLATCSLEIDPIVPGVVRTVINTIKIVIPIVLIVFGIIEMFKAATANDEKVMKEAQGKLIKRIIYAVLIFFVVAIVQLVFKLLASSGTANGTSKVDGDDISACISCFVSDKDSCYVDTNS